MICLNSSLSLIGFSISLTVCEAFFFILRIALSVRIDFTTYFGLPLLSLPFVVAVILKPKNSESRLALNTVRGQEQSEGLLERKCSFQYIILFAEWGIGHKNVPMFGFIPEKVLALLQAASLHFIAFFRKKLIESTPFLIERTPYLLVFRKKLQ